MRGSFSNNFALFLFLGFILLSTISGQNTNINRPRYTNYRIARTRVQKQPIRWPNSLRKINDVGINKEQRGVLREPANEEPQELKLQNSLILNSDGLTYNVVRKQRTDLLRNSKEKSSSITFASNLDSDEVTKALPNKGRKITIVTPSTAVVARKSQ